MFDDLAQRGETEHSDYKEENDKLIDQGNLENRLALSDRDIMEPKQAQFSFHVMQGKLSDEAPLQREIEKLSPNISRVTIPIVPATASKLTVGSGKNGRMTLPAPSSKTFPQRSVTDLSDLPGYDAFDTCCGKRSKKSIQCVFVCPDRETFLKTANMTEDDRIAKENILVQALIDLRGSGTLPKSRFQNKKAIDLTKVAVMKTRPENLNPGHAYMWCFGRQRTHSKYAPAVYFGSFRKESLLDLCVDLSSIPDEADVVYCFGFPHDIDRSASDYAFVSVEADKLQHDINEGTFLSFKHIVARMDAD